MNEWARVSMAIKSIMGLNILKKITSQSQEGEPLRCAQVYMQQKNPGINMD